MVLVRIVVCQYSIYYICVYYFDAKKSYICGKIFFRKWNHIMEKDYTAIFPLHILGNEKKTIVCKNVEKPLLRIFFFQYFSVFIFFHKLKMRTWGLSQQMTAILLTIFLPIYPCTFLPQPRSELVTKFKCCSYSLCLLFVYILCICATKIIYWLQKVVFF